MNRCEQVEKLLLAGEPLDKECKSHVESCTTCQKTTELIGELAGAARQLAMSGEVDPDTVEYVRQAVMAEVEPGPARRWALAASTLTVGVLGVVLVLLTFGRDPRIDNDPGEQLMAFMDEVALDQWSGGELEDLGIDSDLFGDMDVATDGEGADWSLPLSDSYLALEDILEI